MESFIKYFGIIFNCLYIYTKILSIRDISKLKFALAVIFSITMGIVIYFLNLNLPNATLIIEIISVFIFIYITKYVKIDIMITAIIISIGISYGVLLLASIVSTFLFRLFFGTINLTLILAFSFTLSFIFINIIFRIKRLKKGFTFLQSKESGSIGFIISSMIITAAYLIGIKEIHDSIALLLLIGVFISMIGILLWWRHNMTKLYQQRQNEKNIKEYITTIAEKDMQIQNMYECNDYLSKMVHRDNKLIPAMYYAVKRFLDVSAKSNENTKIQMNGASILNELDEIMQERVKIILKNQREHKVLQSTKVDLIDNILNFMLARAIENEIQFDFIMLESVKRMTEDIIPKHILETLLGDLIENAIIAASHSTYKKILVTIGEADDCYEINVKDSGIPFEAETLMDLGLKKATTYAHNGGSGVGYMSIFEILRENNASLIITEYEPKEYAFSKSVKIRFDGKSEYAVHSFRADKLKLNSKRVNMIILKYPLHNTLEFDLIKS